MRTSWASQMVILIDFLVRERLENLGKLQGELFLIVFVILFLGKFRCVFVVCSTLH